MPEHEPPDFEQCAVCGRTALRGERMWDYVTAAGEPRRVCALCKGQAEAAGWLPRELAAASGDVPPRPSRARVLRERLNRAAEGARARQAEAREARQARVATERDASPQRRRLRILVEKESEGANEVPAPERSAERRRSVTEARPADPHTLARRAAERFNSSEARRTVAGLVRSLGEPQASISVADGGGDATVTIAWELSWYQWEIDPGAHGEVREVRKGDELDELSEAEREWNARVDEDGTLRLSSA